MIKLVPCRAVKVSLCNLSVIKYCSFGAQILDGVFFVIYSCEIKNIYTKNKSTGESETKNIKAMYSKFPTKPL